MNRPILRAGLLFGAIVLGLSGCQQAGHKAETVKTETPSPDDPTAWNEKTVSKAKDGSNSGTSNGLSKSSRLTGGLSSESRDIERSLGVSN